MHEAGMMGALPAWQSGEQSQGSGSMEGTARGLSLSRLHGHSRCKHTAQGRMLPRLA